MTEKKKTQNNMNLTGRSSTLWEVTVDTHDGVTRLEKQRRKEKGRGGGPGGCLQKKTYYKRDIRKKASEDQKRLRRD